MTENEAFDIAYEAIGIAEVLGNGLAVIDDFGSIIRGLVGTSPKVLTEIRGMAMSSDAVEVFKFAGVDVE